jgi:predicted DNA-binding transcriptional regulator AlpA
MARHEVTSKKTTTVRLLNRAEVEDLVGVTYMSIWNWMRDGKFPLGRSIGGTGPKAHVAWLADEVEDWIRSRPRRIPKGFKGSKIKEPALSD